MIKKKLVSFNNWWILDDRGDWLIRLGKKGGSACRPCGQ